MTEDHQESLNRLIFFHVALPIFFIAPEVINLGFMFLRWDYLVLAPFFLITTLNGTLQLMTGRRVFWSSLVILYTLFSIFQVWAARGSGDIVGALKYASWPLKMIFWSVACHSMYKSLKCTTNDVSRLITSVVAIVFLMQLLELTIPPFRTFIFNFYPVAASERLLELAFRARGPFTGYDLASMFFTVSGIVSNEISRTRLSRKSMRETATILICLVGSLLAARTGFLLLVLYLVAVNWLFSSGIRRTIALLAIPAALIIAVSSAPKNTHVDDDNLAGRYVEILSALKQGDLMEISSFSGTFYMNDILDLASWDPVWGSGLETETTADQLYFKYLYMYGIVGLSIWSIVHLSLLRGLTKIKTQDAAIRCYKRASIAISIVILVAHVKGGNYFFSARLGELVAFLFLLASYHNSHDVTSKELAVDDQRQTDNRRTEHTFSQR